MQRDDPRRHQRHGGIAEVPEQGLEPAAPGHHVGVQERDEVGVAGGQPGVARGGRPLLRVAQHPDVAVQAREVATGTGVAEPSSTTTTRMPRSDDDQPRYPNRVVPHRDNDGDVPV